ncbi:MAG: hypothetical protein WAO74_08160 [Polaribacter sp.]|uniref:hypothetical protein n=1 Tax=Polaribacter sp. TaxID=1920175 RepID=UPI003BB0366C
MKSLIFKLFTFLVVSSLILSCASESNNQVKKASSKRPTQAITYPEMAAMFKEYDNGQKKVLDGYIKKKSKGKDTIATISEFFTIEELEQYLSYVKRLSAEKEINLTGIKIFTSAYPSDYKIPEYRNRVTFMLAPTAKIKGKNVAYEPLKSTMRKPVSMQSVLNEYADETTKKVNRASIFSFQIGSDDSSVLNRGTLNPPY